MAVVDGQKRGRRSIYLDGNYSRLHKSIFQTLVLSWVGVTSSGAAQAATMGVTSSGEGQGLALERLDQGR